MRRSFSIFHPSGRRKIRRFGHIEAMIESGMIAVRKGDHNFARLLRYFVEWNIVLIQAVRTDQRHFVAQMRLTRFIIFGKETFRQLFHSRTVFGRYCVPCLGSACNEVVCIRTPLWLASEMFEFTCMQIVDRIQIHLNRKRQRVAWV